MHFRVPLHQSMTTISNPSLLVLCVVDSLFPRDHNLCLHSENCLHKERQLHETFVCVLGVCEQKHVQSNDSSFFT